MQLEHELPPFEARIKVYGEEEAQPPPPPPPTIKPQKASKPISDKPFVTQKKKPKFTKVNTLTLHHYVLIFNSSVEKATKRLVEIQ